MTDRPPQAAGIQSGHRHFDAAGPWIGAGLTVSAMRSSNACVGQAGCRRSPIRRSFLASDSPRGPVFLRHAIGGESLVAIDERAIAARRGRRRVDGTLRTGCRARTEDHAGFDLPTLARHRRLRVCARVAFRSLNPMTPLAGVMIAFGCRPARSAACTAACRALRLPPGAPRFRDRPGVRPYSFFDWSGAASACFPAVAGSSVVSVCSVNFSYSQSMRMLSMPAMPPSAYDADTLKRSTG